MRATQRCIVAAGIGIVALLQGSTAGAAPPRPIGDSKVIAEVPSPGFPEGIAVRGKTMYVSSPAQNGHKGTAHVFAFDIDSGTLVRDYAIPATDPITDHGLVGVALDGAGHLYVADIQRGVVQVDLATGQTTTYAAIPDLHPCVPLLPGPCSPTATDRPPFPNDIAFDPTGNAFVTDSFQATVWRIPPGGGTAEPWYQNAALDGPLGPNGIRFSPTGTELCVAVTGPPGSIHCVSFPQPTTDRVLRSYPTEGPDNMAFGKSGKLYVALALANQVSVVAWPAGNEVQRFSGPAKSSDGSVPWDAPAGVAFYNASRSLLVVNHAVVTGLVNPDLFVVFDVFVNDTAQPLNQPPLAWTGG